MNALTVKSMRIRSQPGESSRAAFQVEDALRSEISATDRLILIRKLQLDRRTSSRAAYVRSNAVRESFTSEMDAACHGLSSGAVRANSVWFASRSEARRALLEKLLKGHAVEGWFWKLAVPNWKGHTLEQWTARRLERILAADNARALEATIAEFDSLGEIGTLAAIIAKWASGKNTPGQGILASRVPSKRATKRKDAARDATITPASGADVVYLSLPENSRSILLALVRASGTAHPVVTQFAEQLALLIAPSLRLDRAQLFAVAGELVQIAAAPASAPKAADAASAQARVSHQIAQAANEASPAKTRQSPSAKKTAEERPASHSASKRAEDEEPMENLPASHLEAGEFRWRDEMLKSRAAGLWLAIPTMIRCGWREWLQDRPALLALDPGRFLLRHIAQHHRVADDDDCLLPFGELEPLADIQHWAFLWRRAIDGWLFHKARLRLHHLVWRTGKIAISDERIDIHFPLADADIRLRRHALDVDPGWTDWLGLSVRYHFDGGDSA